jgi:ABC-type transport system substrate-binding protein
MDSPAQAPAFSNLLIRGFGSTTPDQKRGHASIQTNMDDLLAQLDAAPDHATEQKYARQVVRKVYDDALSMPVYVDASIAAMTQKVHNLGYFVTHVRIWTPEDVWKSK